MKKSLLIIVSLILQLNANAGSVTIINNGCGNFNVCPGGGAPVWFAAKNLTQCDYASLIHCVDSGSNKHLTLQSNNISQKCNYNLGLGTHLKPFSVNLKDNQANTVTINIDNNCNPQIQYN